MRNILLVISGPSGVGKGTMVQRLSETGEFAFSVSCTTRAPRAGERDGVEYFFLDKEQFERKIAENEFLEYDNHFGNYYGTPRSFVEETLKEKSVLLDLDVVGALSVKKTYPGAVLVMLIPPSIDALKARLIGRHSESEEQLRIRLSRVDYELSLKDRFDYCVVNDTVEATKDILLKIISEEMNREERRNRP